MLLLFFGLSSSFGQGVAITSVDPGPYTPGSSIAALFSIDAATNIRPDNDFELYLSDASGSFNNEKLIGTFKGLYSTFVNGVIPPSTPAGTGYKLRIKSNSPANTSTASIAFEIKVGAVLTAKIYNRNLLTPSLPELFGFCSGRADFNFNLENQSTPGAAVSALVTNELTGMVFPVINFNQSAKTFTAQQAHYTIFARAEKGGTIGTKAYLIVNNRAITAFGTAGKTDVCLGDEPLSFNVIVNGTEGIGNNYPGTTYRVDWGDNTNNVYTFKDIITANNEVKHSYIRDACGNSISLGSTTVYNAFGISIFAQNQYCGTVGTPISTYAKVSLRPTNKFNIPETLCSNSPSSFVNSSTLGVNPDSDGPECQPNKATFTWYVDGEVVPEAIDKPLSYNLSYQFTPGMHTVTLESTSNASCPPVPITRTICIQEPAKPSFTLMGSSTGLTICNSTIITPVNTSIVDNNVDCGTNTYNWSILPATYTLLGGTVLNSATPPQIKFNAAGVYKIKLTINAQKCGAIATPEQTVMVSTPPTAVLSADVVLCSYGTFDFNGNNGITKTSFNGTPDAIMTSDTYTWDITGGSFNFVNGTNLHSKFPKIQFKEFKVYTIKVTHQNNCGTISDSQVMDLRTAPVIEAGDYAAVCYDANVPLAATLVNGYNPRWVGGLGMFTPDRNAANAVYQPTTAEREAGHVDLKWQISTSLAAPCNEVFDVASIDIRPRNLMTSTAIQTVCSGNAVNYTNVSSIAGSTFTWTAKQSGGVTGMNAIGSGDTINDVLVSTSPLANATVTYRITPSSAGCIGEPFDLVVTVTPKPIITASALKLSICSGESAAITISSNLPAAYNVKYIYTATASVNSISGFTSNSSIPATLSEIIDILKNSGTTAGTVTYRIIPISEAGCPGTPKVIVITVNPLGTVASAGPDETICSNIAYPLEGNIPEGTATGKWTLVSGPAVTFSNDTKYNTTVSGLQAGQTYTFRWTISTTAGCASADDIIITNLLQLANTNISASAAPICMGQEVTITGETPTGGDGKYTYEWERSLDNGNTWTILPGEIGKNLVGNVNATTTYHRITRGGICVLVSNSIKIIVLDALGNNTISSGQSICLGGSAETITGSTPTGGDGVYQYRWQMSDNGGAAWSDISGATGPTYTPPLLKVNTLYRRVVKTTICAGYAELLSNALTITIKPLAKAEYGFQSAEACAPFAIDAFNIKAVPYPDRNGTYTWYVQSGNASEVLLGTGINFPGYIISTDNTTIKIRLVVTSSLGCTMDETVHTFSTPANVRAAFTQDKLSGCGPLQVTFANTSNISSGVTFRWDFGNGQTSEVADPGVVNFLQDARGGEKVYNVTLDAKNACGESVTYRSTVMVRTTPVSIFSPGSTLGCSPLPVTFVNTSPASSTTTYTYDFGDGGALQTFNDKQDVIHTYNAVGVTRFFTIKMTAKNECGEHTSQHTISIAPNNIFAELVVEAKDKQGCGPLVVPFTNNSGEALSYVYDWGDGTPTQTSTNAPEKVTHTFTEPGIYIVKLTAINNCTSATTTETITVFDQPATRFMVDRTLAYPGLKLKFTNATVGAIRYLWDFADGTTSTEKNPLHAFSALGTFKVKLTTFNVGGCSTSYVIEILVDGEPGSLFVPNAFIPGSDNLDFREFKAKGTGILSWRMSIFDKWAAVLWETTKLDDGKPLEGWDGTYRGQRMPQGVYYWKIDLQMRNGTEWKGVSLNSGAPKRTGTINLIR
ncbi:PKD domain-containing protein [Pedobacter sp. JCM 36344]|uniref:PKD domain-containing protein n=1 Tax=Pedobacter sp. JCM 36344 TaxID=3374280 RepID=UPI00397B412D